MYSAINVKSQKRSMARRICCVLWLYRHQGDIGCGNVVFVCLRRRLDNGESTRLGKVRPYLDSRDGDAMH